MVILERVNVYIDGFNLYFGMMDAKFGYCRWLDLVKLSKNLLKHNQILGDVKYFTARVTNDPPKQKRQATYLEALSETTIKIYYGRYQSNQVSCHGCGRVWSDDNEKMTDVNIATQLIIDAYCNKFDLALLISGDSDLIPPINAIHDNFSNKRVSVAFPPKRQNTAISKAAKGSFIIGRNNLTNSQLNEKITKISDGFILQRPNEWF